MTPAAQLIHPPVHSLAHTDSLSDPAHHGVSPIRRLHRLLRAERRDLWVAVVYSVAIGLLSLVAPIATQSLVNTIAFGTLLQPLAILTIVVLVGLGCSTVLQALRAYVVEIIQRRVFVRVSSEVVHRLLRVRIDAFDRYHGPELVNRFLEVVTVQKAGAMLLIDGLSILMQTIIGMILLGIYHPWLLAFDILLLATMLLVLLPMGRGAIPTSIKESKSKYSLVAWLEEVARHPHLFKSSAGLRYAVDRADTLVAQYLTYRAKHFKILLRQIVGSLAMQAIATSVLLGVGGWLVINRQLTLGQLVAAELIVALVVSGFSKFGKHLESFYDLAAAIDKLGYLTDLPLEKTGAEPLPGGSSAAGIRLSGVDFSYPGKPPLLRDITWTVRPASRVGLIGVSGCGKSTLLDMLYGLRPPSRGVIEIDGRDFRELRLSDLRDQIALVRHPDIFHGSVADNLRLGNPGIGSPEIRDALAAVGLLEDIQDLPDGIQTELSTGGLPLSPSQALRLTLARAILRRPRILILDECLERLDDARERELILNTLFASNAPWTLIVATEDPAILRRCGEIYSLRNGFLQHEPR